MFDALAPWLLVAASGALHGLNPLAGWGAALLAAPQSQSPTATLRHGTLHCLLPVAIGHLGAVALAAWLAQRGRFGPALAGVSPAWLALAGLALLALRWMAVRRRRARVGRTASGATDAGGPWLARLRAVALAAWSLAFAASQAVGAGLATGLLPFCGATGLAAGSSGPVAMALAATAVHLAAMLATTGAALTLARATGPRLAHCWRVLVRRCPSTALPTMPGCRTRA